MNIAKRLWRRTHLIQLGLGVCALGSLLAFGEIAQAQITAEPIDTPKSLKGAPRPEPSNLGEFVLNKTEAIALGKALFWDMQVGSDGKTACATCHFQAGADSRSKNQISPGLNRMASLTSPNPDTTFQLGGVNYQFKLDDFPLHKFSNVNDRNSTVLRSINDVATSQGVFNEQFTSVTGTTLSSAQMAALSNGVFTQDAFATWYGSTTEQRQLLADPIFRVGNNVTRRVEPRNSPTVINAVFNFRNFWDGRAEFIFNGVNPFGLRDPNARVYKNVLSGSAWAMQPTQVRIDNASLASQASGPPGSDFEMSAHGRSFPDVGKKLLYLRPLQSQQVSTTDSVLAARRHSSGLGLSEANYAAMVKKSFRPEWWNSDKLIQVNANGTKTITGLTTSPAPNQYTQMQNNFSLFFGLALQLYQATLVSDDAPFDRFMGGNSTAMSLSAQQGLGVFVGKGKCAACHGGAEFTNASVRKMLSTPMARMTMGNGGVAVYDEGFYNIGVRPTLDDLGAGGKDPFGNPLSLSALARISGTKVKELVGINPNLSVSPSERIAVNGMFKTPTLRNVELTAPFFHNGDAATLRQVVDFYNRGGNFHTQNIADLDADITNLGLTEEEKVSLVEFMKSLTDDRVRFHAAPFDHPQLTIPNGHVGSTTAVTGDGTGRAADSLLTIPAVGAAGYAKTSTPGNFLNTHNSGTPVVQFVTTTGQCLDGSSQYNLTRQNCTTGSSQKFRLVPDTEGSFQIIFQQTGGLVELLGYGSTAMADGVPVFMSSNDGGEDQKWRIEDLQNGYSRLRNRLSNKCLEINGLGQSVQWTCDLNRTGQLLQIKDPATSSMGMSSVYGDSTAGTAFTDPVAPGQVLTGVIVSSGEWLDSIKGSGLPIHGGTGGNQYTVSLAPGEHLVRMLGKTGIFNGSRLVSQLAFVTSTGRYVGPFGLSSPAYFSGIQDFDISVPAGTRIQGFTGRSNIYLNAIGVIYGQ
jgi:cytochrome c peroxidase